MFKLALAGGWPVQEIETWSSPVLSEWMAYDQLDLIPNPWWIGAQICQVIAAAMVGKKTSVEDWMPCSIRPVRIMSGEQGKAILQEVAARMRAQQGVDK